MKNLIEQGYVFTDHETLGAKLFDSLNDILFNVNKSFKDVQIELTKCGFIIPKNLYLNISNEDLYKIENNLIKKYQFLIDKISKSLKDFNIEMIVCKAGPEINTIIQDDIDMDRESNNLAEVMSENDYMLKIKEMIKKELEEKQEEQPPEKREEERARKAEESQSSDSFKSVLSRYFEDVTTRILGYMFIIIKKTCDIKDGLRSEYKEYKREYRNFDKKLKLCIKMYYTIAILNQLLDKNYININLAKLSSRFKEMLNRDRNDCQEKFISDYIGRISIRTICQKIDKSNANKVFKDEFYNLMKKKLSEYGADIPQITYSDIPDIENIKEIEDSLISQINTLIRKPGMHPQEGIVTPWNILSDKRNFKDICEFLEKIMKENNYTINLEELVQQLSPNTTVEAPSPSQNGACARDF